MIGSIFDPSTVAIASKVAWDWLGAAGNQAVPVPIVVEQVKAGSSEEWHSSAEQAELLAQSHLVVCNQVHQISNILTAAWTGEGANKAQQAIKPFADAVEQAADTYTDNARNVKDAAHGFDHAQLSMEPMPPRPEKSGWDTLTPWDTDKEAEINKYNELAQRNVELYDNYAVYAGNLGSSINTNYGSLAPLDDGAPPPTVDDSKTYGGGVEKTASGNSSGPVVVGGSVHPPNTLAEAGPATPHTPPQGPTSSAHVPDLGPGAGVGLPNDDTTVAGYTPPAVPPGLGVGQTGPLVPGGGTPPLPGSGPGSVPIVGVGGVPGAGAPSPGGGSAGAPGAGGKGVGAVPGVGAPRPGAALPGVGAAGGGRAGMPITGMPGAGGGQNTRGEDSEHERKYGLADSTIFEPDGDEDGLVDPQTGHRAVPPTIGT